MLNELDLFDFSLKSDEKVNEDLEGWARQARAKKTNNRIHARRASSEKKLDEVLPMSFEDGDSWHVISAGDVDSLSYAAHILKHHDIEYISFSTWCMSTPDIDVMSDWLQSGKVKRIDAYVGEIFKGTYQKEFTALTETIRPFGGRVCIFRNHSKVFLMKGLNQSFVIQSSANINTNPRCENTIITCSNELYEHHKHFFDEIKAFNNDEFTDWSAF